MEMLSYFALLYIFDSNTGLKDISFLQYRFKILFVGVISLLRADGCSSIFGGGLKDEMFLVIS